MDSWLKSVILCVLLSCTTAVEEVKLKVQSVTPVATTDDNFICATLDWWPPQKCDYNTCPWQNTGLFDVDLNNKVLANAIKAFKPLRMRLGGSLEDQIVYKVGGVTKCPRMQKENGGLFGFSEGCLDMERWDELNKLFNDTGALITFGLNALRGRRKADNGSTLWVGAWDSQNARDFMEYTLSKGYKIDSYELGNELSAGGVAAKVGAEQYGKDMIVLKNLVKWVYGPTGNIPKVLGPGGFYDEQWFNTFLQVSGPGVVDGVTHHTYNLGAGVDPDLIDKVQNPYFLDQVAKTYKDAAKSVQLFGPWSGAWVGEAGGAYNSGGRYVSHTFADSFWYMDQLGMTSTFDHKVFCRQAFIGGNYALLNTTKSTFTPNPDYYGALLWHRLMGKSVLAVNHNGSPYLRAYAHCARKTKGIAVFLMNMSNSTIFEISLENDMNLYSSMAANQEWREEYHLSPQDGNILSDVLLLNGQSLQLTESLDIPEMIPKLVDPSLNIIVEPDSYAFVILKDFQAPGCAY